MDVEINFISKRIIIKVVCESCRFNLLYDGKAEAANRNGI